MWQAAVAVAVRLSCWLTGLAGCSSLSAAGGREEQTGLHLADNLHSALPTLQYFIINILSLPHTITAAVQYGAL